MNLQNNLYDIKGITDLENNPLKKECAIHLNKENGIYKAHFPGKPITPGTCIVQMALELTEKIVGSALKLTGMKRVKFLTELAPDIEEITFIITIEHIDNGIETITAIVKSDTTVFAKMLLTCKKHLSH